MKKGMIGPYQLGVLEGLAEMLRIAEKVTHEDGADIEGIFYVSAFQAGVDEFLVSDFIDRPCPRSDFVESRTTVVPRQQTEYIWKAVDATFSSHLPQDWRRNDEYSSVRELNAFVVDLLEAMSAGASLLSPWGIPDMAEAQARLPSELSVPLANLLSTIRDMQAPSPVPLKAIASEDVQRFNEIISSDVFCKYTAAQSALDDLEAPVESSLSMVVSSGRNLVLKAPKILQIRKSTVGILQLTPKLVDTVFGKIPGAVAEVGAKLGISLLESRRRIVIYDFRPSLEHLLLSNLIRMLKAADSKKYD